MHEHLAMTAAQSDGVARFELAPPRRFVLPALLLLLSEEPAHGYGLKKALEKFQFGSVDRPTVYRALAQLETDELVESWTEPARAGHERRVYGITPRGERVLRVWMHIIEEERESLGRVLRRYRATGTIDACLAEIEGGWAAALGFGWSAVSSTCDAPRSLSSDDPARRPAGKPRRRRVGRALSYDLDPERSVVLIEVRSTVGPISFGVVGVKGHIVADIDESGLRPGSRPAAHLVIDVERLQSGNAVYDAELMRRIDARRFPVANVDLRECTPIGAGNRFQIAGDLTFHGVTRPATGTVDVSVSPDGRLVVSGEQVLDIRDFAVPSPTVLMLRIYPDVRVRLHVEAHPET